MNRHKPHVFVLPEDDANRQLANGFVNYNCVDQNRIQVLRPAGGWTKVRDKFASDHVASMEKFTQGFMILLLDFDGDEARRQEIIIPPSLADRVFIIGVLSEPEDLKAARRYEDIGHELAENCTTDQYAAWDHPLLKHNAAELSRLRRLVRPILI